MRRLLDAPDLRGPIGCRNIPWMKTCAMVVDRTASADAAVSQANAWVKMKYRPSVGMRSNASGDFFNEKDTSLFPVFVAVDEDLARRATSEYDSLVDEDVIDFKRKILLGQASAVVLATDKGTVFGAFRPAKQKARRATGAQGRRKAGRDAAAKKNVSNMSLGE